MSLSTKSKRTWTGRRAKSSLTQFTSSANKPPEREATPVTRDASPDAQLLANARDRVSEFEKVHRLQGKPLTDAAVVAIREQLEQLLPHLYALVQSTPTDKASIIRVVQFAEKTLANFPDFKLESLRPQALREHKTNTAAAKSRPQCTSHADLSLSLHNAPPVPGMPPAVGMMPVDADAPTHLRHAIENTLPIEQQLFFAVQGLLFKAPPPKRKNSRWYEPPAAMSPHEFDAFANGIVSSEQHAYFHGTHHVQHQFAHSLPTPPPSMSHPLPMSLLPNSMLSMPYLPSMHGSASRPPASSMQGPPTMTLPPASHAHLYQQLATEQSTPNTEM